MLSKNNQENDLVTSLKHIEMYRDSFIELVNAYEILGFDENNGLLSQLRATVHKTDELILSAIKQLSIEFDEHMSFTHTAYILIDGAVIIVILAMILLIIRSIMLPLRVLTKAIVSNERDLTMRYETPYNDELKEIADSYEGQQENELFKLLGRRRSQTGVDILTALMKSNLLRSVPTNEVFMTPNNTTKIPLNEINDSIKKQIEGYTATTPEAAEAAKNQHQQNVMIAEQASTVNKINSLIFEAEDLEAQATLLMAEAEKKRAKAIELQGPTEVAKPKGRKAKNV